MILAVDGGGEDDDDVAVSVLDDDDDVVADADDDDDDTVAVAVDSVPAPPVATCGMASVLANSKARSNFSRWAARSV